MCQNTETFLSIASAVILGSALIIILTLTSACSFSAKIIPAKGTAEAHVAAEKSQEESAKE